MDENPYQPPHSPLGLAARRLPIRWRMWFLVAVIFVGVAFTLFVTATTIIIRQSQYRGPQPVYRENLERP